MEAQKCVDNHRSTEIEAALKRFEDVCNSLEDQHTKLLNLEKRREKLNEDLQSLRNEIKQENDYFRSVVDENVEEDIQHHNLGQMVEPATLDTGAIKEFIQVQREELASIKEDVGLERLKEKLEKCKSSYFEGTKYRQEVAVEPMRQHGEKCITADNDDIEITDITAKPSREDSLDEG